MIMDGRKERKKEKEKEGKDSEGRDRDGGWKEEEEGDLLFPLFGLPELQEGSPAVMLSPRCLYLILRRFKELRHFFLLCLVVVFVSFF